MSLDDIKDSLRRATHTWAVGYVPDKEEDPLAGMISLTICDHLRLSTTVDIAAIMSCFVRCDFEAMRQKCRQANLRAAVHEAQLALCRWKSTPTERLCMITLPFGKCTVSSEKVQPLTPPL